MEAGCTEYARLHPFGHKKGKSCEREHSVMSESERGSQPSRVPHAKPDLLIVVRRRSCGVAIAPTVTVGI